MSCASGSYFHTKNFINTDYLTNVTVLVWYGDPRYLFFFKKYTPIIKDMEFANSYNSYMEYQTNKFGKNHKSALKTINFYFSVDF